MNSIKGIYYKGVVEPITKPHVEVPTEVIIIFPEETKKVTKIEGLFKDHKINYSQIEDDLQELSKISEDNLLNKKM